MTPLCNVHATIENVSRRGFLRGLIATGGLVVAAEFVPTRGAFAAYRHRRGQDAAGRRQRPACLRLDRPERARDDRRAPRRNGHRLAHQPADGGRRRARSRLVARQGRAIAGRREEIRQPEHRRLAQPAPFHPADAPMRRRGAAHARSRRRAALGRRLSPRSQAQNHEVVHKPSGRKLGYGDLAAAASALPTPPADQIKLKDASAFRYIGKGTSRSSICSTSRPAARVYGIDAKLAGHEIRGHCAAAGHGRQARLLRRQRGDEGAGRREDRRRSKARRRRRNSSRSAASRSSRATPGRRSRGARRSIINWDDGPHASYDSAAYKAQMEETARKPGKVVRDEGDAEKALGVGREDGIRGILRAASRSCPDGADCATARFADGKCEVWAAVQSPGGTRDELAKKLGLKPEDVTVNVTLLGGGFGRKSKRDFVLEAALLSREMGGAPVKVIWTREDDLHHDYLHTVSAERIDAGLDAQGQRRRVAPPQRRADHPGDLRARSETRAAGRAQAWGPSTCRSISPICAARTARPKRIRASAGSARCRTSRTAFAIQSFVAELADAAGRDPKDMLLELIGPPRIVDPRKSPKSRLLELRRPARNLPDRHGAAAARRRARRREGGMGQETAAAAWPRHRRASQLPELCRDRRRGRGGRQGTADGAARRHRDRLRLCRQPRAHLLADRRRGGDGAEPRANMARSASRTAASSRTTSTASRCRASTSRRRSRMSGSSPTASTCRRAASASRGCRPSRRPCATRSSPPPASASAACRSATSWRPSDA